MNKKKIHGYLEKYCPDYEIKRWDESTIDLSKFGPYLKEAYDQEEWAFVSDVVRLYALVTEGGIYMDTDIEVVKPLDELLTLEAFMGFEIETKISTGIIGRCRIIPLWKNGTTITMTENLSGQKNGRCRHQCDPSDGTVAKPRIRIE